MRIYLTFNQNSRLYSWLIENRKQCVFVTGVNPLQFVATPISGMDLRGLTYTHADFPPDVQWWINKNCPYPFAKKKARAKGKTIFRNWFYHKFKQRNR